MGRPFVSTGVGRIGPVGIGGPVDPAPDRFREELRSRITTLGGRTGWKTELVYFYSRAFRCATRCRGSCESRQRLRATGSAVRTGAAGRYGICPYG